MSGRLRCSGEERPHGSELVLQTLPRDLEAPYFLWPAAGGGDLSCPHPSSLLVRHIYDREASEVLLGLAVGAIGEDGVTAGSVHAEHGRVVVQAPQEDVDPRRLHFCPQRLNGPRLPRHLLVGELGHPLSVKRDEVFGHVHSLVEDGTSVHPVLNLRTVTARYDAHGQPRVQKRTSACACGQRQMSAFGTMLRV